MNNLTKEELENRIDILNERITSLNSIKADFKCPNAIYVLEVQINNYSAAIRSMEKELLKKERRN